METAGQILEKSLSDFPNLNWPKFVSHGGVEDI